MRLSLLLVLSLTALTNVLADPPVLRSIEGPSRSCSQTNTYRITSNNLDQIDILIEGGRIVNIGAPVIMPFRSGILLSSPTLLSRAFASSTSFNSETIVVEWNTTGTRRLTAIAKLNNKSDTKLLSFSGQQVEVIGTSNFLCISPNGTVGQTFRSNGPAGATISWTSTSSNGIPLSFSSRNTSTTTVSGFRPGVFYSVNVTYSCPGGSSITKGNSFPALDPNQPQCGGGYLTIADYDESARKAFIKSNGINLSDLNHAQPLGGTNPSSTDAASKWGENRTTRSITVFPNPLNSGRNLTIQIPTSLVEAGKDRFLLKITDVGGREIYSSNVNGETLSVSLSPTVPVGYYLVRIIAGGEAITTPLIIR